MAETCTLIGDLGGTHARFALAGPGRPGYSHELTLDCEDYDTAEAAISGYLQRTGKQTGCGYQPSLICLAVAGPVMGGAVRFLNNHWRLDSRNLRLRFPGAQVKLLNDYEAVAWSVPLLQDEELEVIGPVQPDRGDKADFTLAVLGPGTGLGVAGLISRNDYRVPIVGEGGHSGFAAETWAQSDLLEQLRGRFERVSNERLLSGPGLENIYWALSRIRGEPGSKIKAPEIFKRALSDEDGRASETLRLFYQILGQVAGDLALELSAYDGVYIAGGIVWRYPGLLKASTFRSGFENKGRYRDLMERIPTYLILHSQPGLLGASQVARQIAGQR